MKIKTFLSIASFVISFVLMSILTFANDNNPCVTCGDMTSCENSSIELAFFELSKNNAGIVLKWMTKKEKNNDHFNIYASTNGYDFEYVKSIDGQGNTDHASTYKAFVNASKTGEYYYYIEQVDADGTTESFVPEMIEFYKSN